MINTRDQNWDFLGTASDPEGQLNRVEFRCNGDNCGNGSTAANGTTAWSYNRTGMAGQNEVYFIPYDNLNQNTVSRRVTLRIDLAAPNTTAALNGESTSANWPAWFTTPVNVRLNAQDGATARARAGVRDVHYRVDGGAWQTQSGESASFTVNADGAHTVEYYAVDHLDNQEATRSVTFRIDQTPPSVPSGAIETGGTVHNQWQRLRNTPTFTWAASSDATSGLWFYQLYFGSDPNGVAYNNFPAAAQRQWTPYPAGVPTGVYYLRGRARDIAGNWSAWTSLFTFKYDGTPPENPADVTHAADITSTVWQRVTNTADFHWPVPHDEGSGIQGYHAYWGLDPEGVITNVITSNAYVSTAPLCALDSACTGYLRLRSVDNVGNLANEWSTAFVLRYDNAPPVVDFTFNGGVTQTAQTQIMLNLNAGDLGSGVRAMRFSTDGQTWTSWEAIAPEKAWTIPAISRQFWPLYVQVKDGVDLESAVISHTVYLEANRRQPQSANFRLFDHNLSGGANAYTSTVYTGRGTLGQIANSVPVTSASFSIRPGYEAGSLAIPIIDPDYETFQFINGVLDSGGTTVTSTLFVMRANVGEFGLPNNIIALASAQFSLQPGFLAAQRTPAQPITPEPGPTPSPEPALACESPSVRINNDAPFTDRLTVALNICAPRAVQMMLGHTEDLAGAVWEPYAEARAWTLPSTGELTAPRFVYAAFKTENGTVYGVYFDDIIYDPIAPGTELMVGDTIAITPTSVATLVQINDAAGARYIRMNGQSYAVADSAASGVIPVLAANSAGGVDIFINGHDDNSGLAQMEFSLSPVFTDTIPEAFAPVKPWTAPDGDGPKTLYARFFDNAGNVSEVKQVNFIYDATPPYGWVGFDRYTVNQSAVTVTVYLAAADGENEYEEELPHGSPSYIGTVTDMRVSADANLADAMWEPYTDTLILPRTITGTEPFTFYAQYRDLAGNVSEVYSNTYQVDAQPPTVYAAVAPGVGLTRTLNLSAYDDLSGVTIFHISNDPLMIANVVTLPYTDTVTWIFDDTRVVWVQAEDAVGNRSEPYPAYAEDLSNRIYLPLIMR